MIHKDEFDGQLQMGVKALTEDSGRESHRKTSDAATAEYADPHTGELRAELGLPRHCPVCKEGAANLLFTKNGFGHVRCNCGMVYVNPMLSDAARNALYGADEAWTKVQANETEQRFRRKLFEYGLERVTDARDGDSLLDVGCGPGLFMEVARAKGWQVAGVEINAHWGNKLKQTGERICIGAFEDAVLPNGAYDCISMWDVLEHVPYPYLFIRKACKLLAPGGKLLLLVPNFDSLANRMLHEKSRSFDGAQHVNLYTEKTLTRSLDDEGFDLCSIETVFSEVGPINNHLANEPPYTGSAAPVVPFLHPALIHAFMLGCKLLAVARRRTE